MTKKEYEKLADGICERTDFIRDKMIYIGGYYKRKNIRNIIFSGRHKNNQAVLKIYNDQRPTDEPLSLERFNKKNKSKILLAPKLYDYGIISSQKGWFIAEKLTENGKFFTSPLLSEERKEFLNVYLEYNKYFPRKPHRLLTLAERLRGDEFHIFRINRWFELAVMAEQQEYLENKRVVLKPAEFIPRYRKSLKMIKEEFKNRKMIWCHGHFKPHEIYKKSINKYYLVDFAHTKMYPEGYELGFIIWADWLMSADWMLSYKEWKKGIVEWIEEIRTINRKLKLKRFDSLIRASLIERCLGTILADIVASDKPFKEKKIRVRLLYRLIDEVISGKL